MRTDENAAFSNFKKRHHKSTNTISKLLGRHGYFTLPSSDTKIGICCVFVAEVRFSFFVGVDQNRPTLRFPAWKKMLLKLLL